MNKKHIYTGAYLLYNPDNKSQFGIVDGKAEMGVNNANIRVSLGKQILKKMIISDDETILNLTLDECNKLSDVLKKVENSINLLTNLSKRDKLKDEAYLLED
jgi:hypothetical protein